MDHPELPKEFLAIDRPDLVALFRDQGVTEIDSYFDRMVGFVVRVYVNGDECGDQIVDPSFDNESMFVSEVKAIAALLEKNRKIVDV